MEPTMRILRPLIVLAVLLVVGPAHAFDASNPDDVGLALFPFEPDREEDASLAFLLEDYLQANLPRSMRHPVYTGRDLLPAIPTGTRVCIEDDTCVRMLGGQFNVSLVARVQVFRSGPEIQLEVAFYATGNGLLIGRENTAFQVGDEDSMVAAFGGWWKLYFDTSLRVSAANRAGEGGVLSRSSAERARAEDYRAGRSKKVSSRRTDFGSDREPEVDFDRSDPTGDLRALVGDDDDNEVSDRGRRGRRSTRRTNVDEDSWQLLDEDIDLDDDGDDYDGGDPGFTRDRETPRRTQRDRTRQESSRNGRSSLPPLYEDDDLDDERSRGSVRDSRDDARAGYGPREYKRYTSSGQTLRGYAKVRWENGGRFYLRAGAFYGGGWLTRRYATIVFVNYGKVKTDEYRWERLGISRYGNPGGSIGFGFAPHKVIAAEVDVGFMLGEQDLRREYEGPEIGTNWDPADPTVALRSQSTLHIVVDVRARFFVFPSKKFKLTPGFGITTVIMQGFEIKPEPPLDYSSRPVAAVLGLTPLLGFVAQVSPFVAINVDATGTVYIAQGGTRFEVHTVIAPVIEPGYLDPAKKQAPIEPVPIMGRIAATAMFLF
jgi:hypothetical protein